MTKRRRTDETWFARELPGRWRGVAHEGPGSEVYGDADLELAKELRTLTELAGLQGSPDLVCQDCRHLITRDADGFRHSPWNDGYSQAEPEDWSSVKESVGAHFHNEDWTSGKIRYYVIHPMGGFKEERTGTWTEAITKMPYLVQAGNPVPPRSVITDLSTSHGHDMGMSGGVEMPDRVITDEEYQILRAELIEHHGAVDVRIRMPLTHSEFSIWRLGWTQAIDSSRQGIEGPQ